MKKLFVVKYNDKYGNGDNTSLEVIVDSKESFLEWLRVRNEQRENEGELTEHQDEFDLIPLEFFQK
jgi:hypothetical protein